MASTGGGITPPVMGISAFIMAEFLGISYLNVIGYAVIPCVLFYAGIIAGVHFEALKLGLQPVPKAEIPSARSVFTWGKIVPLFLPIAILLGLLFSGFTLVSSGFYASVGAALLYLFADLSPARVRQRAQAVAEAIADGGVAVAKIVPILVCVGMFTSLLGMTGVAPKVSGVIVEMGGENLIGSLLVAAAVPLILGAPLPVTATYILSAALIAPALVKIKIDVVAAHMFLLYWATLASVTPPTCTGCVIAANISGGNWLRSSFVGMKLGIVAFLVPFFFVVNPALIGRGAPWDVAMCAVTGLAGAILMAGGFFGFMRSRLNPAFRVLYFAAGVLLLAPSGTLSLAGAGAAALGLVCGVADHAERAGRRAAARSDGMKKGDSSMTKERLRIMISTGHLGTAPSAPESFHRGMDSGPDYLVADGGSSDPGRSTSAKTSAWATSPRRRSSSF